MSERSAGRELEWDELFSSPHKSVLLLQKKPMQSNEIIATIITFERPTMSKPCGSS